MKKFKNTQGGYIILVNTLLFLGIMMAILLGAIAPVISHHSRAAGLLHSKQAYLVTRSASEEAFYRLKTNKTLPASVTLSLSSGTATILTSDVSGTKNISVSGETEDYERNMEMSISAGAGGINFNYGLQAGGGGVTLSGGSSLIGNIYSNSTISAISATITGTAVAADSASLTADQTNQTPTTPPTSTNFRNAAATQDFAQSFQVSSTAPVNKVQLYLRKTGAPSNSTIIIASDNSGSPASTALTSATMSSGLVTTSYGWVEVVFATPVSLIPGTTYWVMIQNGSTNASNYYTIGTNPNTSYTSGQGKTGRYGSTWTATNTDGYFRIYTGGVTSYIGGATYVGGVNIGGDAWASNVRGASVTGNLWCTTGTNNNKACNTTHGAAPQQGLPFSDGNLQDWKDDALAGGTQGTTTIGWAGGTMGAKKINGNLTVNGGGTLTLTGPIWVTGNVSITGGGKVVLPSGYALNSEVIIADGTITVNGGGSAGSGNSNSFLFMVSTSKCPNAVGCSGSAINISGGAGAIAASAQYGNVALSGGAAINAVVGNSITATGGTTVTYNSGLASPSFQSGPSGEYVLQSWVEN